MLLLVAAVRFEATPPPLQTLIRQSFPTLRCTGWRKYLPSSTTDWKTNSAPGEHASYGMSRLPVEVTVAFATQRSKVLVWFKIEAGLRFGLHAS